MNMQHNVILSYKDIYPEQARPSVEEFIQGLDKKHILDFINYLNTHQASLNTTTTTIAFLAKTWFSSNNRETFNLIFTKIQEAVKKHQNSEITIFNPQGTLTFVEKLISYLHSDKHTNGVVRSNTEIELNLLKAYLVINQESDLTDNGIEEISAEYPDEGKYWLILLRPFQYADLINRDNAKILFTEIGKAVLFFKLLFQDKKNSQLLETFFNKYNVRSWEEYLTAVASLSVMIVKSDIEQSEANNLVEIVPEFPLYKTCIKIIDQISVPLEEADLAPDYMLLRNYPIFKTGENRFQIIYARFLIEKIFKALYFELRKVNNELKVMSDNSFRRFYTSEYSEKQLSYYVLNNIFKQAEKTIECDFIEEKDPQFGPTDYVAFSNRNIFLFESKDVLIKKEIKQEMYLPHVRDALREKFYKDGKRNKALVQLAMNIVKVMNGEYEKYGLHLYKYMFFYPVIVVHSDAFNVFGINQILKQWFREACQEVGISKKESYKIKDPVIVDINTLLLYQEHINSGKIKMNHIIDSYNYSTNIGQLNKKGVRSSVHFHEQYCMPFSYYLENYIGSRKKIRYPKNILDELRQVFDKVRVSFGKE